MSLILSHTAHAQQGFRHTQWPLTGKRVEQTPTWGDCVE